MYEELRKFTKMKVWDENGEYMLKVPDTAMSCGDFIQELVVPMLKVIGYSENSIKEWIEEE